MIAKKVWLIKVGDEVQGPFSKRGLRRHPNVTPDTWAKKENWPEWKRVGEIEELDDLFHDEEESKKTSFEKSKSTPLGEVVLETRQDPPHFTFWLVIALLVVLYFWLKIQGII